METTTSMGMWGLWSQTDAVGRWTALLLLGMSVLSWYLIVWKGWRAWRARRRAGRAIDAFWNAGDLAEAVAHMQLAAPESPFAEAAAEGGSRSLADRVPHDVRAAATASPLSHTMTRMI